VTWSDCFFQTREAHFHEFVGFRPNSCSSDYHRIMYKAMFLIAFDGFLHVGEFRVVSTKKESHYLQISDIGWSSDG
jgi:hypothetical protein